MNYIYVRQSSTKEDRSISCEEQISNCIQFATQNNMKVEGVFQDVNVSGRLFPKQFASLAEADIVYKQFLKETKKEGQWRNGLGQLFDVLKEGDTIIVDESNSEYKKSGPVPDNCEYATLRTFRLENATLTLVSEPEPISKQKVALKFGGNKIITYLCS